MRPAGAGWSLPAALLGCLVGCTWQVAASGPLCSLDARADRAVASSAVPSWLAGFLADLGDGPVAGAVLAAVLGYLVRRGRREGAPRWWLPPLAGVLAVAAVPALVVPFKALVARPAPAGPLAGQTGFYPSGHAATAAVCYGAAVLLLLPRLRQGRRRPVLVAVALLNVAVGVGLVRRGYHWPLDVVASWCLCGCLLWALRRATRPAAVVADAPRPGPPPST